MQVEGIVTRVICYNQPWQLDHKEMSICYSMSLTLTRRVRSITQKSKPKQPTCFTKQKEEISMKGAKCPHCESTIPMFHIYFKPKKLSKKQRDRNRKFRSLGYKLSCLQCEQEFEVKSWNPALVIIPCSIVTIFLERLLPIPIDTQLLFRVLFPLVIFIPISKALNRMIITTWPIREISE